MISISYWLLTHLITTFTLYKCRISWEQKNAFQMSIYSISLIMLVDIFTRKLIAHLQLPHSNYFDDMPAYKTLWGDSDSLRTYHYAVLLIQPVKLPWYR